MDDPLAKPSNKQIINFDFEKQNTVLLSFSNLCTSVVFLSKFGFLYNYSNRTSQEIPHKGNDSSFEYRGGQLFGLAGHIENNQHNVAVLLM